MWSVDIFLSMWWAHLHVSEEAFSVSTFHPCQVLNVRFMLLSSTPLRLNKTQNETYLKQFHFVGVHFHDIFLLEKA
jgi:hypothetical protein